MHRFFDRGEYHLQPVQETLAPAMDICVSSNFERFLYHMTGDDATELKAMMTEFEQTGKLPVSEQCLANCRQVMCSANASKQQILETIRSVHEEKGYLLDPHSAVAMFASQQLQQSEPIISLAC